MTEEEKAEKRRQFALGIVQRCLEIADDVGENGMQFQRAGARKVARAIREEYGLGTARIDQGPSDGD